MLRKFTIKKLCLTLFCLITMLLLYLFPKANKENLTINTKYEFKQTSDVIFLIDKNYYVSRVNINLEGKTIEEKIKSIIDNLTIKNKNDSYFKGTIPINTKLNSIKIDNKTLYIDFSKELLNINPSMGEKMIESIVFSLTSLKDINDLVISINGQILNRIPGTNEPLDSKLNRSIGINKVYDITNLKGLSKITFYYLSKNDDDYYYVPITKITNDTSEKIEIIIKELTTSSSYNTSLMSYLNSDTKLKSYDFSDNKLTLDFNDAILSNVLDNALEEQITYAINLSIKDNYDIDLVYYNVDNKKIATFNLKSLD